MEGKRPRNNGKNGNNGNNNKSKKAKISNKFNVNTLRISAAPPPNTIWNGYSWVRKNTNRGKALMNFYGMTPARAPAPAPARAPAPVRAPTPAPVRPPGNNNGINNNGNNNNNNGNNNNDGNNNNGNNNNGNNNVNSVNRYFPQKYTRYGGIGKRSHKTRKNRRQY